MAKAQKQAVLFVDHTPVPGVHKRWTVTLRAGEKGKGEVLGTSLVDPKEGQTIRTAFRSRVRHLLGDRTLADVQGACPVRLL